MGCFTGKRKIRRYLEKLRLSVAGGNEKKNTSTALMSLPISLVFSFEAYIFHNKNRIGISTFYQVARSQSVSQGSARLGFIFKFETVKITADSHHLLLPFAIRVFQNLQIAHQLLDILLFSAVIKPSDTPLLIDQNKVFGMDHVVGAAITILFNGQI